MFPFFWMCWSIHRLVWGFLSEHCSSVNSWPSAQSAVGISFFSFSRRHTSLCRTVDMDWEDISSSLSCRTKTELCTALITKLPFPSQNHSGKRKSNPRLPRDPRAAIDAIASTSGESVTWLQRCHTNCGCMWRVRTPTEGPAFTVSTCVFTDISNLFLSVFFFAARQLQHRVWLNVWQEVNFLALDPDPLTVSEYNTKLHA